VKIRIFIPLFISFCFLFYGCSSEPIEYKKPTFEKTGMVMSLGANSDLTESILSYVINIRANKDKASQIKNLYVTVGDKIAKLLKEEGQPKIISDMDVIMIEGELSFESEGLTKVQLDKLAPYIVSLEIELVDGSV